MSVSSTSKRNKKTPGFSKKRLSHVSSQPKSKTRRFPGIRSHLKLVFV